MIFLDVLHCNLIFRRTKVQISCYNTKLIGFFFYSLRQLFLYFYDNKDLRIPIIILTFARD